MASEPRSPLATGWPPIVTSHVPRSHDRSTKCRRFVTVRRSRSNAMPTGAARARCSQSAGFGVRFGQPVHRRASCRRVVGAGRQRGLRGARCPMGVVRRAAGEHRGHDRRHDRRGDRRRHDRRGRRRRYAPPPHCSPRRQRSPCGAHRPTTVEFRVGMADGVGRRRPRPPRASPRRARRGDGSRSTSSTKVTTEDGGAVRHERPSSTVDPERAASASPNASRSRRPSPTSRGSGSSSMCPG